MVFTADKPQAYLLKSSSFFLFFNKLRPERPLEILNTNVKESGAAMFLMKSFTLGLLDSYARKGKDSLHLEMRKRGIKKRLTQKDDTSKRFCYPAVTWLLTLCYVFPNIAAENLNWHLTCIACLKLVLWPTCDPCTFPMKKWHHWLQICIWNKAKMSPLDWMPFTWLWLWQLLSQWWLLLHFCMNPFSVARKSHPSYVTFGENNNTSKIIHYYSLVSMVLVVPILAVSTAAYLYDLVEELVN